MLIRIRSGSPTDSPTLMHIEHSCRTAATFLPLHLHDPGQFRPRQWRAWLNCHPPFDRHPSRRAIFVAYEHNNIFGFIACMHDSLFGGYDADIIGLYVLPRHRRRGIGGALLVAAARWLQADGVARVTADCYAKDPTRSFFNRLGGFVIASAADDRDPAAIITYGFANLKELAARND